MREPQFYITSFAVENIVLIVYLWEDLNQALILTWYLSVCSTIVTILKWRTIWRYLVRFKILSFTSKLWYYSYNNVYNSSKRVL